MRREHPLWRGFWLALAWTAVLYLLGGLDTWRIFRGDGTALIYAGGLLLGGLLGALPSLLRKGLKFRRMGGAVHIRRLAVCFGCGALMTLGSGLAGRGSVLTALLTGSAGAYGFCLMALAAGFAAVRLLERRPRA